MCVSIAETALVGPSPGTYTGCRQLSPHQGYPVESHELKHVGQALLLTTAGVSALCSL